jgi:hypothetical protein
MLVFHCLWGVIRMGATLRMLFYAALRPLFLSALLALAWLAWGAGTAFASPNDPGQLHALEQSAGSTFEGAADATGGTARTGGTAATVLAAPVSLVAAPPAPLQHHHPPVRPTVKALPGITVGPVIRDVARPVSRVLPASITVAPVVDTAVNTAANAADAVLSRAAEAVTAVADTTDPVVTGATEVVDAVVSTPPAVPGVSVPTPLAAPPLPFPLPLPLPLPDPAAHTPAPDHSQHAQVQVAPTAGQAAVVHAGTLDPKPAAVALQSTRRSSTPARILQNTPGVHALATTAGSAVAFVQTTVMPDTEEPLRLAIPQGQSGSASSGSGGASAPTQADLAGYWSPIRADSGARMPDTAQTLAACPSFDPGSSPD